MKIYDLEIYTDGSCNHTYKIGGWAALIFHNQQKVVLSSTETDTTHNRMELVAVIKSIEYVLIEFPEFKTLKIFTDSQYVEQIPIRASKLVSKDFITKSGNKIQNRDLLKKLIDLLEISDIEFIKVKAHQKQSELINYNREVDKLSRKLVRDKIAGLSIN